MTTYLELESRISSWCRSRPDILTAIVIGSRGRLSPPPDDYSDLDLILFVVDPGLYTADSDWIAELGAPWIAVLNQLSRGDPEWLVLFQGGLKADLLLITAEPNRTLDQRLLSLPYQQILTYGVRILYDGSSAPGILPAFPAKPLQRDLPTESEFEHTLNNALFTAERMTKLIKREDNWRSQAVAGELKQHILALTEWHARSAAGIELDTWYDGRFMDEWADGRVVEATRALNLGQRDSDLAVALSAALELIEWLVTETAVNLGYLAPTAGQQKTLDWLKQNIRRSRD